MDYTESNRNYLLNDAPVRELKKQIRDSLKLANQYCRYRNIEKWLNSDLRSKEEVYDAKIFRKGHRYFIEEGILSFEGLKRKRLKYQKQKDMKLTLKQHNFCFAYIKSGNKSEAYREAYDTERMQSATVNRKAFKLFDQGKIRARIEELQGEIQEKELYTVKESIKRDLRLLDRYDKALDVLEDKTSTEEQIKIAERTIRQIGSNGFSSSQDRLAKKLGFYEKDNSQKKAGGQVIVYLPDNGRD